MFRVVGRLYCINRPLLLSNVLKYTTSSSSFNTRSFESLFEQYHNAMNTNESDAGEIERSIVVDSIKNGWIVLNEDFTMNVDPNVSSNLKENIESIVQKFNNGSAKLDCSICNEFLKNQLFDNDKLQY